MCEKVHFRVHNISISGKKVLYLRVKKLIKIQKMFTHDWLNNFGFLHQNCLQIIKSYEKLYLKRHLRGKWFERKTHSRKRKFSKGPKFTTDNWNTSKDHSQNRSTFASEKSSSGKKKKHSCEGEAEIHVLPNSSASTYAKSVRRNEWCNKRSFNLMHYQGPSSLLNPTSSSNKSQSQAPKDFAQLHKFHNIVSPLIFRKKTLTRQYQPIPIDSPCTSN